MTSMQKAAHDLNSLPRAEAAKLLGLKSPHAVAMRLLRARIRRCGSACKKLRAPSHGRMVSVDPVDFDYLARRN